MLRDDNKDIKAEELPDFRRNRKSTLRTIRMSDEVARSLQRIGSARGLTFNAVANRALKTYAEFEQFAEKLNFVTMHRETFKAIVASMDEESVSKLGAELGSRIPREVAFYMYKKLSVQVFFDYLGVLSSHYRFGTVEVGSANGRTVVAIHHDLGRNWSVFLCGYLREGAHAIMGVRPVCEIGDDIVMMHFDEEATSAASASEARPIMIVKDNNNNKELEAKFPARSVGSMHREKRSDMNQTCA